MNTAGFKKYQYDFTAHIRDPDNHPVPAGIEPRRMKIYSDLLYNNIESFISSGFPVIHAIYSSENWHRMVRDFFSRHRCKTPYFLEIAQEFIDYLQNQRQSQPEDPAGLVELAHYEWVELALHVADEEISMAGINANGDLLDERPVLSPLAWSLVYRYPVHRMGPDYLPDDPPEQATCLMVYRNRKDEVKFLEINPVTARLVSLLQDNENFSGLDAIEQIIREMNHPDPDTVKQGGRQALAQMQQYGIILGTAPGVSNRP